MTVSALPLPPMESAPRPEFEGPGGPWSLERLLTAALADCFMRTFRAVARAARFDWIGLDCRIEGTLERIEGQSRFTGIATTARLTVPPAADRDRAKRLLEQAENGYLIANSLRAERALLTEVLSEESTAEAVHVAQGEAR